MINSLSEFLAFDYAYKNGYSLELSIAFVEAVSGNTKPDESDDSRCQGAGRGFVCYRTDRDEWNY